jgi:hypothetical protein
LERIVKIRDVRIEPSGAGSAAVARFEWEDSNRPPVEVSFRTPDPDPLDPSAAPAAFLIAGFFPAMHHGEHRVAIEGSVCPSLRNGLLGAGRLFDVWYGHTAPRIEPDREWGPRPGAAPEATASFLSGGVDSLHALRNNHRLFPDGHPGRVRECLFVHGLDLPGGAGTPAGARRLSLIEPLLSGIVEDAGVGLRRIGTDARLLEPDVSFWAWEYVSPPLAAAAHLLSRRFSTILLGSSYDFRNLVPWGSHPLLDPLLGSSDLAIEHVGASRHRLEKLRDLLAWPAALRRVAVCNNSSDTAPNCGVCGKCLRTMAEMIAVGAPQPETLPRLETLRPEDIDALPPGPIDVENFWSAVIPGLAENRRPDLAAAVSRYLRRIRSARRKGLLARLAGRLRRRALRRR